MRSLRVMLASLALAAMLAGCHGRDDRANATASPMSVAAAPMLTDSYLTDDRDNTLARTTFPADTRPIYLMFAATGTSGVPIRAVWMADQANGGTQSVLAESEMISSDSRVSGTFAQRSPVAGWKTGPYQVDVYFGQNLVHSEHFTVVNKPAELSPTIDETQDTPAPVSMSGGVPSAPSSPADQAGESPQPPTVTPIPSTPYPTTRPVPALPPIAQDAFGRVIMGVRDSFQIHTSRVCRNVTFTVNVNDRRQGVYAIPDMTSDISLNFHPGPNSIRITWDAPDTERECQLAMQLNRNHRTRTLTTVHVFRLSPPHGTVGLGVVVQ